MCFSDIGGEDVKLAFSSGQYSGEQSPTPVVLEVQPEPRLLRVTPLTALLNVGQTLSLYEIGAFDANRDPITMDVDLELDTNIIEVDELSVTLNAATGGIVVDGTGKAPGSTTIHVRPLLLDSPDCTAAAVTVQ